MIAAFGAKLLKRSMLPAWKLASAAAFVPFLMSTTYVGPTLRPSALIAHQLSFRFQIIVGDCALKPDW